MLEREHVSPHISFFQIDDICAVVDINEINILIARSSLTHVPTMSTASHGIERLFQATQYISTEISQICSNWTEV